MIRRWDFPEVSEDQRDGAVKGENQEERLQSTLHHKNRVVKW